MTREQELAILELEQNPRIGPLIRDLHYDPNFVINFRDMSDAPTISIADTRVGQCGVGGLNINYFDELMKSSGRDFLVTYVGLVAHELGHIYADYHGADTPWASTQNALDWENQANFPILPTDYSPLYRLTH